MNDSWDGFWLTVFLVAIYFLGVFMGYKNTENKWTKAISDGKVQIVTNATVQVEIK